MKKVDQPKYLCTSCGEQFPNWSQCLSHVRLNKHEKDLFELTTTPEGRRALQKMCKYTNESGNAVGEKAAPLMNSNHGSRRSLENKIKETDSVCSYSSVSVCSISPDSTPYNSPLGSPRVFRPDLKRLVTWGRSLGSSTQWRGVVAEQQQEVQKKKKLRLMRLPDKAAFMVVQFLSTQECLVISQSLSENWQS